MQIVVTVLRYSSPRNLNQCSCLDHVVSSPRKYFKWKSVLFMFIGVQSRQLSSDSNQNRLISVSRKFSLQMRTASSCSSSVTQSIEFHFDFPYDYENVHSTNNILNILIFLLTMRSLRFSHKESLQDCSHSLKVFWRKNFKAIWVPVYREAYTLKSPILCSFLLLVDGISRNEMFFVHS